MEDIKGKGKVFVLDTNVLLHNALALRSFADNTIVLPITVLEELDKFKSQSNELGRNAREAIRTLDNLRTEEPGSLGKGVPTDVGGMMRVVLDAAIDLPQGFSRSLPDDRIIGVAYELARETDQSVIFVSKDINARVKADAVGLKVMDYENQKVNFDELYTGRREIEVESRIFDLFYSDDGLALDKELQAMDPQAFALSPNEFVLLRDKDKPKQNALGRWDSKLGRLVHLDKTRGHAWNISPRSNGQRVALEALLDDNIKLVTLVGIAGTGKTLLAMAAAIQRVVKDNSFEKLLVTRPIMPMGKDIGYLPGSKDDKMMNWMLPIFDNLKFLLGSGGATGRRGLTNMTQEQLLKNGTIELEAITYIRGRSISDEFIIVDEAQNLTPHEVKTIISRCGDGTKIVLTGDPYQIDNPYLDASSNGLTYCVERLRSSNLTAHVTLTQAERSPLSELAAELL